MHDSESQTKSKMILDYLLWTKHHEKAGWEAPNVSFSAVRLVGIRPNFTYIHTHAVRMK